MSQINETGRTIIVPKLAKSLLKFSSKIQTMFSGTLF